MCHSNWIDFRYFYQCHVCIGRPCSHRCRNDSQQVHPRTCEGHPSIRSRGGCRLNVPPRCECRGAGRWSNYECWHRIAGKDFYFFFLTLGYFTSSRCLLLLLLVRTTHHSKPTNIMLDTIFSSPSFSSISSEESLATGYPNSPDSAR